MQGLDSLSCLRNGPLLKDTTQTIVGPIGIVVLAGIFFVYSRTSIQAAKENAKRHREADGGSISWRNESLRRHGALKKPEERSLWQQLTAKDDGEEKSVDSKKRQLDAPAQRREYNPIEEGIRRARAKSYNTPDDT